MKNVRNVFIGIVSVIAVVVLSIFVISQINKRAYLAQLAEIENRDYSWLEEASRKKKMLIDDAIANKKVIEGMSPSDVVSAIGYPDSKRSQISGNNRIEIWLKGNMIISFIDWGGNGKLTVTSVGTIQ